MLLPPFYGAGHLKIGQIQTALGQFLSFQLVREKMFTDITDIPTFAEIFPFSGSSGEYRMENYFKCVMYEGKKAFGSSVYNKLPF